MKNITKHIIAGLGLVLMLPSAVVGAVYVILHGGFAMGMDAVISLIRWTSED